MNILLGKRKK